MAVQVIGDEALVARFNAAAAQLVAEERFWLHDTAKILKEGIETNIRVQGLESRVKRDSGAYAHPHLIDTGRIFGLTKHGVSVGFGKGHPGAEPLELGAVAHVIEASRAPQLSFWWAKAGEHFIGPRVYHPGNRAYRYVYNGTLGSVLPIASFFVKRVSAIFGGL